MTIKRILWPLMLLGFLEFYCFGCTIKVPLVTTVEQIAIQEKLPVEAGLLITKETSSFIFRGRPDSLLGTGNPYEFPLGMELEIASIRTFSQIFKKITLIRTAPEAKDYRIIIEPQIEDFHFALAGYPLGCHLTSSSKIKVHITLVSGEADLWEKSVESPWHYKTPLICGSPMSNPLGETAADALADSLKRIATEMIDDKSLIQILNNTVH
jgi:hypothetical protein